MKKDAPQRTVGQEILDSLSEFKAALEQGKPVRERFTIRKVTLDLEPKVYQPADILQTRKLLHASQPIFAKFLGVSVQTIRAWEQGDKSPRDVARRFMDEIRRDPEYWRKRLRSVIRVKAPTDAS
jgi:putative transcriptional regulator